MLSYTVSALKAEQIYNEKLREAEKRHREYIESVRGKAGNENTKVTALSSSIALLFAGENVEMMCVMICLLVRLLC